jgi:hypothetical protein
MHDQSQKIARILNGRAWPLLPILGEFPATLRKQKGPVHKR